MLVILLTLLKPGSILCLLRDHGASPRLLHNSLFTGLLWLNSGGTGRVWGGNQYVIFAHVSGCIPVRPTTAVVFLGSPGPLLMALSS